MASQGGRGVGRQRPVRELDGIVATRGAERLVIKGKALFDGLKRTVGPVDGRPRLPHHRPGVDRPLEVKALDQPPVEASRVVAVVS